MTLYSSYQSEGGNEEWTVIHADTDLDKIQPTFVTILACDTLLTKGSPKNMLEDAKYLGPMYFDLDSEDIEDALAGAKQLWRKLKGYGLSANEVEIYLSGKKGLHLIIPPKVFMDKQVAVSRLPAIYKEMAFTLSVDTLDFSVYSGRRGRMLRTCYNQRDNGNYKVQITSEELMKLTKESYAELCSAPRARIPLEPAYVPQFAILYEGIRQKVVAFKKAKPKPASAADLRKHKPIIQGLMRGEGIREGTSFNKIAIQLAIYAHEVKMSVETLIEQCKGLTRKHLSDSSRYNSVAKREEELRRMFDYLEEGAGGGYEYAIGPINALLESKTEKAEKASAKEEEGEEAEEEEVEIIEDPGGISERGHNYFATSDQGEKHIMDAVFKDAVMMRSPENEQISCIAATIKTGGNTCRINMERADFNNSTGLHRAVSALGASFTGTDVHARYIYTSMVKESKQQGKVVYSTEREGLDVMCMPMSAIEGARKPFLVWADASGVQIPTDLKAAGLDVRFVGYPTVEGVMRTDLAKTELYVSWSVRDGNKDRLFNMLRGLLTCQDPTSLSKLIGWMVSCFYSQLLRRAYGNFPLLHVNGAAGSGKSEMTEALMHLFYDEGNPVILGLSSSLFATQTTISGSASIPIIVDEYKPHEMTREQHNALKSLFRSCYNGHSVSKGGGNRQKDSFAALSSVRLSGPTAFIAEAIEQEVALLERCVLVTLRRPSGLVSGRYRPNWITFKENKRLLSQIGSTLAAAIVDGGSMDKLMEDFAPIYKDAREQHMMQEGDYTSPRWSQEDLARKSQGLNERVIYNHAVAKFGLTKFKHIAMYMLPEKCAELETLFAPLEKAVYNRMDDIVVNTMPEYCKILVVMSDMSRFPDGDVVKLTNKLEYELGNIGEISTLTLVGRLVFSKYRQHCRNIGTIPLFNHEGQFIHALKDSHLFIKTGVGTSRLRQETLVLDAEQLVRMKVEAFSGK
jgi:hypothetical protein